MVNVKNEICYVIAWNILNKLRADGVIDEREFDVAHMVVADRFCPLTVRR